MDNYKNRSEPTEDECRHRRKIVAGELMEEYSAFKENAIEEAVKKHLGRSINVESDEDRQMVHDNMKCHVDYIGETYWGDEKYYFEEEMILSIPTFSKYFGMQGR